MVHYSGQVIVVVVGLATTRLALEKLGLIEFGQWAIGLNLLGYIGLADFGVLALLTREIGRLRGRHPGDALPAKEYVSRSAKLTIALMPLLAAVALGIWFSMPREWAALEGPLALLLIAFVALFPGRLFVTALSGVQDHAFAGLAQLGGWAVGTVISIGLLLADAGLYSLSAGWIAQTATSAVLAAWRLRQRHGDVFPSLTVPLFSPGLRSMFVEGSWQTLNSAAVTLFSAADVLVVGLICGAESAAGFSLTMKLLQTVGNYATAALQLSLPALAEARERLPIERVAAACQALLVGQIAVSGGVAVIVLAGNAAFLRLWLNRTDADLGPAFLSAACASLVLRHANTGANFTLFTLGYNRRIPLLNGLDGILSVAAMGTLVWWLGPIGAPCGTGLVLLGLLLPWNLHTVARELQTSVWSLVRPHAIILRLTPPAILAAALGILWLPSIADRGSLALALPADGGKARQRCCRARMGIVEARSYS